MPKLVKLESHREDNWLTLEADAPLEDSDKPVLLSLKDYIALDNKSSHTGVWLSADNDVSELKSYLESLPVVAIRFESFADGRGFSQARLLRDQYDFKGEVRAIGYFLQDQLHYLLRCGFSEFSVADDADIASMQESMKDFSESYQAASDVSQPLFRRRQ